MISFAGRLEYTPVQPIVVFLSAIPLSYNKAGLVSSIKSARLPVTRRKRAGCKAGRG